jgi:hypothetical protein
MGFVGWDICGEILAGNMALCCKSLARCRTLGHSVFVICRRPNSSCGCSRGCRAHIGPEAADTLLMDDMTWTWIAVLVLAPIGLIVYGAVSVARRFLRRKA